MISHLKSLNRFFTDCLFPEKCLNCQKLNFLLCPQCAVNLKIFPKLICPNCNHILTLKTGGHHANFCSPTKTSNYLNGLWVGADWNNLLLKNLIYNFKYNFVNELGQILGNLLARSLTPLVASLKIKRALLIPIPLHPLRLRWRGFNQAEILANVIGQKFNWPMVNNLIIRQKHTRPQMTIDNVSNRYNNVSGIFSLKYQSENEFIDLSKRTIFLVDDVCTTGATLQEAARCLKSSLKHCSIYGLVIARA